MTFFRETTQQYAHRQNLARYRRLLATHLTAEERRFVERRVAEEQAALRRLSGRAAREDISTDAS
jgi:RecB family exonuclease